MAMSAMRRGIHVYCQKPMAHDLYEVRQLTRYAAEHKLVTQMGIQIHSNDIYRNTAKLLKEGIIGKIKETWSWCGSSYGSVNALPGGEDPIPRLLTGISGSIRRPSVLTWPRSIIRKSGGNILDLGTGVFGDMGCHIFDNVFSALELTSPTSLRSEGPAPNKSYWATRSRMHYVFPGHNTRKARRSMCIV
jgi:predicted dehydrogenase